MRRLLVLALSVLLFAACQAERQAALDLPRGPIILISIDTLRADRIGAWGYSGASTPAIDALASDGVLFENAWSHVPLTLPAHVSVFTGRLPYEHGVRNNIGYQYDAGKNPSIVDALRGAGYATGGAASAYVLRETTGISAGFDFYDAAISSRAGEAQGRLSRRGSETAAIAAQWVERQTSPFFLFLHIFEPHTPYDAPEPFRSSAATPYDAEVSAADAVIGEFLDRMKAAGIYDDATIILMSDHGEGLGDHGEDEHGIFLYREAIHVPLIVKLPRSIKRGSRVRENVQLADIAPTIASLAHIAFETTGTSLLGTLPEDRRIYSETYFPRIHLGWSQLRSLISGSSHYIEAPAPELYDMSDDPAERKNVIADNRRVYAALRDELSAIDAELTAPSNINAEDAAKLAALGYLGTARDSSGELPDPKDRIGDLQLMKAAATAAANGDNATAINRFETLLAANPRFADAWHLLGKAYEQNGDFDRAVEAYKSAAKAEPSLAQDFALSIGSALYRAGRLDDAMHHAELAKRADPPGARMLEARIRLARNDAAGAERIARELSSSPTHGLAAAVLTAEALTRQGRLEQAMQVAVRAEASAKAANAGQVDGLAFVLGDLWARQGELERAEKYFQQEISAFPHKRQTYANLALLYSAAGRRDDARATMRAMVQANPGPESFRFAASTLATLGDDQGAAEWKRAEVSGR